MIAVLLEKIYGGFWGLKNNLNKKSHLSRFYKLLYQIYLRECGSYVGATANFKNRPIFPHGCLGIFISGEANIGENCVIFHHVTIGSNTLFDSKGKGSPKIGDNCYIGAGAKIIGNVTIGDNVRVGANCVVFSDIPSNSVVVLQPPKIIKKSTHLENKFYRKCNGKWVYENNGELIIEKDNEILKKLG